MFMRLTEHLTFRFARLVQAMSASSAKTRRAPSRHYRDARVYDHTTTAMHENEYPPPPAKIHECDMEKFGALQQMVYY